MKKIWTIIIIILNILLIGCSPFEITEAEKISEEILEDVVEKELKGK